MPRHGDPEKIYYAQRAGIFMRLVSEARLDRLDAEHWLAGWEREAEATGRERGFTGYGDDAWAWIERERAAHNRYMTTFMELPARAALPALRGQTLVRCPRAAYRRAHSPQ